MHTILKIINLNTEEYYLQIFDDNHISFEDFTKNIQKQSEENIRNGTLEIMDKLIMKDGNYIFRVIGSFDKSKEAIHYFNEYEHSRAGCVNYRQILPEEQTYACEMKNNSSISIYNK